MEDDDIERAGGLMEIIAWDVAGGRLIITACLKGLRDDLQQSEDRGFCVEPGFSLCLKFRPRDSMYASSWLACRDTTHVEVLRWVGGRLICPLLL